MIQKSPTLFVAFLYTAITSFVFMQYFYKESISLLSSCIFLLIIYAPVFLAINKNLKIIHVTIVTIFAFCIGFTTSTIIKDVNIWPIALVFWLMLSMPIILLIDLICFLIRRHLGITRKG